MRVRRLVAAAVGFGLGVALGSCSSASDFVADSWPHFAGGEPAGLPPRPGSPGYAAFIAHGQPNESATSPAGNAEAAAPGATSSVADARAPAQEQQAVKGAPSGPLAQPAAVSGQAPTTGAAPSAATGRDAVQGGLY